MKNKCPRGSYKVLSVLLASSPFTDKWAQNSILGKGLLVLASNLSMKTVQWLQKNIGYSEARATIFFDQPEKHNC